MSEFFRTGLLGTKLSNALQSLDLFTWFQFECTGESPLPEGGKSRSFRPNGTAFRSLVELRLTTNAQGMITTASLRFDRTFIDSPSQGVFAGDLAKSFVGYASSAADSALTALRDEIHARSMGRSSRPVITRESLPATEGTPSAAYLVYSGQASLATMANSAGSVRLNLENRIEEGEPKLVIELSSISTKGWLVRLINRMTGR